MPDRDPPFSSSIPTSRAVPKNRTRVSLVWLIPVLAALVGVWVAVTRVMSEGPKIKIIFATAEGMEAGKTKIRYNGVDIGTVIAIRLSEDHKRVIATAQMAPKTESFLVKDSEFWVVRPRISGANVTGLGTLISGAYVGIRIGTSTEQAREFQALETQPVVTGTTAGKFFVLKTSDLGSIDYGTPIFFRRLQVGQVSSYQLDKDGKFLTVKVFVQAPYDQFVDTDTRFWQASGIDMSLSASGLKVQTQSVLSILIGGIAFESPTDGQVHPPADSNTDFVLYTSRAEAFQPPAQNPQTYELDFADSVRGLAPGAPVEFRGIEIGSVTEVRAQVDARNFTFSAPVTIHLDPRRLGVKVLNTSSGVNLETMRRQLINALVSHGVRAQLRTGSLLTGALYVAFDIFPEAPPVQIDWSQKPVRLPTVPGQLQMTEASVEDLIRKIDKMPLQAIGDNLEKSLADLDLTLVAARGTLTNASSTLTTANMTLTGANGLVQPNSAQMQQINTTLQEFSRAARSLRVLSDYLEQHPEALLRGKSGGPQ